MRKLEIPRNVTTILVQKDTVKDLKHIARKDQTYDQLIKELMQIRLTKHEAQKGLVVTSNQNQQDGATVQSAGEQIDNAINRQTTN